LLVEFDANGVVKDAHPVRDADLPREFSNWLARTHEPPLDYSEPALIIATRRRGHRNNLTLSLGRNFFGIDDVRIAPQEITGIETLSEPDPAYVSIRIRFTKGSAAGKGLSVHMHAADLLMLVKYLQQNKVAVTAEN
jgi:hypothetical protein